MLQSRPPQAQALAWKACAVSTALEMMGGRWQAVILFHLLGGSLRFGEIQRYLPGVGQRVLAQQLRELEADGVFHPEACPEVRLRVEHSQTEFGHSLGCPLSALRDWGEQHRQQVAAVRQP